jgi:ADP-dependent NAD(P)H-hydrate dehydratase / NAD(P)H-hydrate epimerase
MTSTLQSSVIRHWITPRPSDAHKGSNGHVLLWAGSRGMSGAAVLAATAALRAGAGLVTVAIPESERTIVMLHRPEALTLALPDLPSGDVAPQADDLLLRYAEEKEITVLALGPGLSQRSEMAGAVKRVVKAWRKPLLIDADGLNNLTPLELPRLEQLILTPHPGEFSRFFSVSREALATDRSGYASRMAQAHHLVCLLKGHETVISDGITTYVNSTGSPAMATGGMGDVLTGAIAGLLAQGLPALKAAAAGAYLHGVAADLITISDRGLLAMDVAHALPQALRQIGVRA